ncbi:serine/threonine-protein kinase [Kitasatospora sp. NPDC048298]|uniref:serine/threonine-protein kinase n=1 Tax=Kitasatospora sp. NPDC048298 TaxID=3364049 RepID=UPI0037103280
MRDHERRLVLDYESLHSMPIGVHEVHVWWDQVLHNWLVGKKVDLSEFEAAGDLIEPRVMEMIKHPNIVDVRAVANVPGYPQPMRVVEILMPYFEQGSITDALERGETFAPTKALRIIQAALQGLTEMHEHHGILHRDIKSPNLFLTGDADLVKIGDLGVAGAMDASGATPAIQVAHMYAPPEMMVGPRVTRAADLYSMGLVLLELLAGKFDYDSYTSTEVVDALQQGRPPLRESDRQLPAWVCRRLRRLVLKATHPDPTQRFSSARDMSAALASVKIADWREVEPNVWQAPHLHRNEHWKITATPSKDGGIELATFRRRAASWRRNGEALVVPSIGHPQVVSYFEKVNNRAVS